MHLLVIQLSADNSFVFVTLKIIPFFNYYKIPLANSNM